MSFPAKCGKRYLLQTEVTFQFYLKLLLSFYQSPQSRKSLLIVYSWEVEMNLRISAIFRYPKRHFKEWTASVAKGMCYHFTNIM